MGLGQISMDTKCTSPVHNQSLEKKIINLAQAEVSGLALGTCMLTECFPSDLDDDD